MVSRARPKNVEALERLANEQARLFPGESAEALFRRSLVLYFRHLFFSLAQGAGLFDPRKRSRIGTLCYDNPELIKARKQLPPDPGIPALETPVSLQTLFCFGAVFEEFLAYMPCLDREGNFVLARDEARGQRRSKGTFFTPEYIVRRMVKMALGNRFSDGAFPLILDPAMGAGYFLAVAVDHLTRGTGPYPTADACLSARRAFAERCIFGMDIDPLAVEVARLGLSLFTMGRGGELPALDKALLTGDALFDLDPLPPSFPAAFSTVLGNPPYGDLLSPAVKESLPRHGYFKTGGRAEISAPFIQQGLRLLGPGGSLAYIVPNTLRQGRQFGRLRAGLTKIARVEEIVDYTRTRVFKDAWVYSMILHLKSGAAGGDSYEARYLRPEKDGVKAPLERVRIRPGSEAPWRTVDARIDRLVALGLTEDLSPLAASCHDAGLDYKYRAVGWTQRGARPRLGSILTYKGPRRHALDRPLIRGGDIQAFRIKEPETFLIHDWKQYRGGGRVIQVYPDRAEVPVKILTRQTGDRLVAAIDRQGRYTAKSVHTLIMNGADYSPEFLCALLNSRAMNGIYSVLAGEKGRTFAQVRVSDLRRLPFWKVRSLQSGRVHPLWKSEGPKVEAMIAAGETDGVRAFLSTMRPDTPEQSGAVQVLVTRIVRALERRWDEQWIPVLDLVFDRLYGWDRRSGF